MNKWPTRPTSDRVKESLFNILENNLDFESMCCLDLFSGSGSISLEFLSRGAVRVHSVEKYFPAVKFTRQLSKSFNLDSDWHIYRADVFNYLEKCNDTFDIIFADPPYKESKSIQLPEIILESAILRSGGILIIEHDQRNSELMKAKSYDQRIYGDTTLSFYRKEN